MGLHVAPWPSCRVNSPRVDSQNRIRRLMAIDDDGFLALSQQASLFEHDDKLLHHIPRSSNIPGKLIAFAQHFIVTDKKFLHVLTQNHAGLQQLAGYQMGDDEAMNYIVATISRAHAVEGGKEDFLNLTTIAFP